MRHLPSDLRYAWRGLLRSPIFTLVALISMALGIGANTAIFTLVDQVLLRRLPVSQPEQLVLFTQRGSHYGSNNGGNATSYPMYEDFRESFVDHRIMPAQPRVSLPYDTTSHTPLFSGLFARFAVAVNVGFGGTTERVPGEAVTGTFFPVLGVGAALGRVMSPDDDKVLDGNPVAVLSYNYWRTRFAADPNVVGQSITVNNVPVTIIGVVQDGFDSVDIGSAPNIYVPLLMRSKFVTQGNNQLTDRRQRWVNVFGRLAPGVTAEQAKSTLAPFFHMLRENETREPAFRNASVYSREQFLKGTLDLLPGSQGRSYLRQQLQQPLWMLMGIVAGVLLIACANVASLLIARAAARQKEIAVRLALGASRSRIIGQLLAESLLLSLLGGLFGLIVAAATTRFLLGFMPTNETPHVISAGLDLRVLGFNLLRAVLTGLAFGLVPAWRSTRPSLSPTLKDQVGAVVGGSGGVRLRKGLVVVQVMLSVLLLIGAGLFIRSLRNLQLVDLGVKPESLVAFNLNPTLAGYLPVPAKQFYQEMLTRLQHEPGVSAASIAQMPLFEGSEWDSSMTIEGYAAKPGENMSPYCNAVSPGYFKTLGTPLIAGRDFDERDTRWTNEPTTGTPTYKVAIVNQSFVKHYFGDANPIGRHIGFGIDPGTPTPIEIIGVVGDSKYTGVRDEIPRQAFFPLLQNNFVPGAVVYMRSTQDPSMAFTAARRVVREMDAKVPVYNLRTLERQIERSLLNERLVAILSSAFGILATLLAIVGLYGVMAFTVAKRTREIGLRIALGAATGDVLWLVMREVVLLVGAGVVLGVIGAWSLSRVVSSQLYGLTPTDPITIAAAALLLAVVALLAGYIPAHRATRVNPVRALRYD